MANKTIVIHCQNHFHFIRLPDIYYCQSDNCYTTIYLESKSVMVSRSLTNISKELPAEQFIRVSQSYLINKDMISSIDKRKKTISLTNGLLIPFTIAIKSLIELMQRDGLIAKESGITFKEASL